MQLEFDQTVEEFRAEFTEFLDAHLPDALLACAERPSSSSHVPGWARQWQRLMFDHGWLQPGYPPEFGGRNATVIEQYVYFEELSKRRIYQTFNPQGVGIIAASLIHFGTPDQQSRWAIPILRAEMTASLGMSEPGAGSDLASLRTRAIRDGDHFVVNGQKVWTSGAHDADVLFTLVRTDPDAPKHKGISVLLIPTDLPGVTRRPFPSACGLDDVDFNEVFFTDVHVPAENLVGELNGGWLVANGSLGHERTLLWLSYADRLKEFIDDWVPVTDLDRDAYAKLVMDDWALRLMGSAELSRATRGVGDPSTMSVLKLMGSEAIQAAADAAFNGHGAEALRDPAMTSPFSPYHLESYTTSWFTRYLRSFGATIAGGTSEIQRNIIAQRVLGLPRE
ncbi:Acyl-CoA dehydrogenase [Mycobacterium sp. 88mf]|uniref:Acyl-CoA dehydrogenase n=1 Tax=Mycolicibacterium septicum DSM 44393 TaxID=1341646 RepID=A0A7X6RVD3_9MYCO|nr:acyl-CoA dehydrogenase family protein [Mycolicibacterium septicum]NKZ11289.1 acyl-CoA dehydrogenase [Mycolicibacterium septicum DSM 44393]SER83847.1 Acyl-CoA dehydrogenase [Mycobacterium sp. 88mf]SFG64041.1 Acyl-CoA dehydrogenase [Mycobacterium sp. 455mf]